MKRRPSCKLLHCLIVAMFAVIYLVISVNAQSGVSVPQAVYDEMAQQGYTYPQIVRAYELSLTLGSSPLEIMKFKPKDLSWEEYGAKLQTYKKLRKVMKAMDDTAKNGGRLTAVEGYDLTDVATKRDVIVVLHGADPGSTDNLKALSFSDEQTLALLTIARIYGRTDGQLAAELAQNKGTEWWPRVESVIAQLNSAVGLL